MHATLERGFLVTLLLATACGDGGKASEIRDGGAMGNTGAAGGEAGGEPATAGGAGGGSARTGVDGAAGAAGHGSGNEADAAGGGAGDDGARWLTPPLVAPALVAPSGTTLALHLRAEGAQIYTCTGASPAAAGAGAGVTTYAWVLKAPDAKLFDASGAPAGTHGAGPNWASSDGSVAKATKVIELSAPVADAIPWLLLRVTSTTGPGLLADVTYVQRLSTVGGKAPAGGCDAASVGGETRVGDGADYYFYREGAGAAWLARPAGPSAISLPSGLRLKQHTRVIGHNVYGCLAREGTDAGASAYAWVFKTPDALLFDETFTPVGSHGVGPRWTSSDLSAVVGRERARADAPRPGASPWLLFETLAQSSPGAFGDVTFVQRVNTTGGAVPASACDSAIADTQVRVPFSADDYFYAPIGDEAHRPRESTD